MQADGHWVNNGLFAHWSCNNLNNMPYASHGETAQKKWECTIHPNHFVFWNNETYTDKCYFVYILERIEE